MNLGDYAYVKVLKGRDGRSELDSSRGLGSGGEGGPGCCVRTGARTAVGYGAWCWTALPRLRRCTRDQRTSAHPSDTTRDALHMLCAQAQAKDEWSCRLEPGMDLAWSRATLDIMAAQQSDRPPTGLTASRAGDPFCVICGHAHGQERGDLWARATPVRYQHVCMAGNQ